LSSTILLPHSLRFGAFLRINVERLKRSKLSRVV